MKKKLISIMLVGAMVASMGAMAGCGGDKPAAQGSAGGEQAAPAPSGDPNTLTLYCWDPSFNIPAMRAAEEDYKANVNPDFTLEILEQSASSDVETAITLAGSSNDYSNLPDIVLFQDHYFKQFMANVPGAWSDAMTQTDKVNWDDFSQEKLDYSTIDGKHYGVPVDAGTAIMAYRVDLLEAAGYTIDDMTGISWDEFIEVGQKVYDATGKYLLCMDGDGNDLIYMMCQAEGVSQFKDGEPYLAENEVLVKVIEKIVEMVQKNVLYLANDWSAYTNDAIQKDMVAGVLNGNWIIATMTTVTENSGKWEITTLPTLNGGEGYASNGGSSLYITSNCQNTDLAVDFLSYTFGGSTATYDAALKASGVIGTYLPAAESEVYNEGVEFFNNTPINAQIAEMTGHVPTIEQNDAHYACRRYLAAAIQAVVAGGDLNAAIADAESQLRFEMGLN